MRNLEVVVQGDGCCVLRLLVVGRAGVQSASGGARQLNNTDCRWEEGLERRLMSVLMFVNRGLTVFVDVVDECSHSRSFQPLRQEER